MADRIGLFKTTRNSDWPLNRSLGIGETPHGRCVLVANRVEWNDVANCGGIIRKAKDTQRRSERQTTVLEDKRPIYCEGK